MLFRKYKNILLFLLVIFAQLTIVLGAATPNVSAAIEDSCPDGATVRFDNDPNTGMPSYTEACTNHQTGGPSSDTSEASTSGNPQQNLNLEGDCKDDGPDSNTTALDGEDCAIVGYVITFTNVLSGIVGIVIVIMIAVGGIQYSMARDDPQAVGEAKNRIKNAILALVFYLFAFAFLQWLVPGGIF